MIINTMLIGFVILLYFLFAYSQMELESLFSSVNYLQKQLENKVK
ncbi:Uncharacterised protein [Chryseobacterium carnipullorum]|uniref:Uncharacterized protein n=1 Tax=Chryseobacterium carnipullorum TaxID=1124835 RepID=A0A376E4H9_CHRCU|nr:Uncharacterised protein [Chryseobacterium carnipullorum]